MLDLEFAQVSDPGLVREGNEDFLGHFPPATAAEVRSRGWLFALADGVGGRERGEVASKLAVESAVEGFRNAAAGTQLAVLLPKLVHGANGQVYAAAMKSGRDAGGMATTLVLCGLRFDQAVISHVGDSRCYLIRDGRATPLTRDHTMAADQANLGLLSAQEAMDSHARHVLSRAVGADLVVTPDTTQVQVNPEDVLMLCSDGLHGALPTAEIAYVISQHPDLQAAAERLVAIANERDGSDNVSVQLIRIHSVERMGITAAGPFPGKTNHAKR
jgi:serine/threonine protein phosphatase PrpC